MYCEECGGSGQIEQDDPQPHAHGFNMGYIDTTFVDCEFCDRTGLIPPTPQKILEDENV